MRTSYRLSLFLALLLLLTVMIFGCSLESSKLLREQTIVPPSPTMGARTSSPRFSESITWRKSNIYIRSVPVLPPVLLAGHGYVAFIAFNGGPLSSVNQLQVLDANSGAPLWQSERFPDYEAMALNKDEAFVLLDLGRTLNIYNIGGNGEPLHSYNYFKEFTQFYMFPVILEEGEDFYIYYRRGNEYLLHRVNPEGEKAGDPRRIQMQVSDDYPHLLLFRAPFFLTTALGEYVAANFDTGEELWRISVNEEVTSWPVLQNDRLIIPVGTSLRCKILAVDVQTGELLWETEKEFGSNVVLHKGGVYALRNDAVLVRLELATGRIEEEIPFQPTSIDSGTWAYLLASDGEQLFVYFGDSQELFALKMP